MMVAVTMVGRFSQMVILYRHSYNAVYRCCYATPLR